MSKTKPLVSVVVTTYNRKEFLKEKIDSILNQTFTDFELIVVDNYSNYDFFAHIESFNDSRIRAFQNQNDGIIAVNRNVGIKRARGEYIAFCDDDDYWMKEKLEKVVSAIQGNPEAILFCHNEIMVVNGEDKKNLIYGPYKTNMYENLLFKGNCISLSAVCLKTNVALETGGFSERSDFISVEDYEFWLRLSKFGKFHFIDDILGCYRIEGNNISKNIIPHWKAYFAVINFHLTKWLKKNPNEHKRGQLLMGKKYTTLGNTLRRSKNYNKAYKYLFKGIKMNPLNWKSYAGLILLLINNSKL